ncbi:MAG: hypothetical protein A2017_20500 [Lentisphaerae bacterium GWF2_44_16]|nr:MAG: hypothetical protein A2017_20500 [Lentisphaerae bacterium GWF2_44_16]
MTDQQRGDALGIEGHPILQTPYLDSLSMSGIRFTRAYSACPTCVPARRTLMSGKTPHGHGVYINYDTYMDCPTLPECFSKAGYQTHLAGKLHLWPKRKLYGFHSSDWADGPGCKKEPNDYTKFLECNNINIPDVSQAHGMDGNGWVARPWHLEERFHITNWTTDRAINFLERRDPTLPFFLKVSYFHPHQPGVPPEYYFNMYMNMELPEPARSNWSKIDEIPRRGISVSSPRINLDRQVIKQFQAGYYGCITHIDHQIGRILKIIPSNTIIIFTSDHGEMLGDHGYARKGYAFEGSSRIPLLFNFPSEMHIPKKQVRKEVTELMDIMPTLLDAAGIPVPDSVDGKSLMPLITGKDSSWREYIHGEIAALADSSNIPQTGMQYLTDGKRKYIWHPGTNEEFFFNLEIDPKETDNLISVSQYANDIKLWKERLIKELDGRDEGFTDGRELIKKDGISRLCSPELARSGMPYVKNGKWIENA